MVNTKVLIYQLDERLAVRQVYTLVGCTVIHRKCVVVGAYGTNGHFTHGPLRCRRSGLSRQFQCGIVAHFFGRPRSHACHAQETTFYFSRYHPALVIFFIKQHVHKNLPVFHTDVLPASYRGFPVVMVIEHYRVLFEFFQVCARSQHTETVGVHRFIMYAECIGFAHRFQVLFGAKLRDKKKVCKSVCKRFLLCCKCLHTGGKYYKPIIFNARGYLTLHCNKKGEGMSKTLTNQQKKDWAKLLYMQGELQSKQIAEKVGINPVTMSKWSKEGNWDMLRAAITTTREEQVRNMYMQIAEINKVIAARPDKYATSAEADTINKLSAAINKMEGEYGIADIISVSKQILFWLRKRDPEKAIELSYYFDEFVKEKLR
nr:MAG TPA: Protein of unknown function (DUF1804) [Caudoviricetes sp.]